MKENYFINKTIGLKDKQTSENNNKNLHVTPFRKPRMKGKEAMMLWSCSWDEKYTRFGASFAGVGSGRFLGGRLIMTDSCEKGRWTSLCFVFESSGKKRWWFEDKTRSCGKASGVWSYPIILLSFRGSGDHNTASFILFFLLSSSWDNFSVWKDDH